MYATQHDDILEYAMDIMRTARMANDGEDRTYTQMMYSDPIKMAASYMQAEPLFKFLEKDELTPESIAQEAKDHRESILNLFLETCGQKLPDHAPDESAAIVLNTQLEYLKKGPRSTVSAEDILDIAMHGKQHQSKDIYKRMLDYAKSAIIAGETHDNGVKRAVGCIWAEPLLRFLEKDLLAPEAIKADAENMRRSALRKFLNMSGQVKTMNDEQIAYVKKELGLNN